MNHQETILKALVQKPSLYHELAKYQVTTDDFDNAYYRHLFAELKQFKQQDYVTEAQWLTITNGESDPLWNDKTPDDIQHVHAACEHIAHERFWRNLQQFTHQMSGLEKTTTLDTANELHQQLFEQLVQLKPTRQHQEYDAKDTIHNLFLDSQKRKPIPTGYTVFDEPMRGGFRRGLPSVIAGASGNGKTMVGLNFIVKMCLAGYKVDFLSLEMTKEEVMEKVLYILMGEQMMNPFEISEQTATRLIQEATEKYERYIAHTLRIFDNVNKGSEILAYVYDRKDKADVIFIDYIQRVQVDNVKSDNPFQKLGDYSLMLTESVKGSSTALILLSQITNKHEPFTSQLKNTGQIENDIAIDLRLMRERDDEDKPTGNLLFKAVKNRFGVPEFECSIPVEYKYQRLGEYHFDPNAEPHVTPKERADEIFGMVDFS